MKQLSQYILEAYKLRRTSITQIDYINNIIENKFMNDESVDVFNLSAISEIYNYCIEPVLYALLDNNKMDVRNDIISQVENLVDNTCNMVSIDASRVYVGYNLDYLKNVELTKYNNDNIVTFTITKKYVLIHVKHEIIKPKLIHFVLIKE